MKIIKTTLPLPAQVMVEFFQNKKGVVFQVDYEQSVKNLRTPQALLNYIANLKLHCELEIDKIPVELLTAYVSMRDVVQVPQLIRAHANVLYFCKYHSFLYEDGLEEFDLDSIVEFIKANPETILVQLSLLNSIPLFTATAMNSDADADRSQHELVTTVDEAIHPAISVNLFNLFTFDTFLVRFLEMSVPIEDQIYFKPHFDSHMYGGKTMFGWFAVPNNLYFALCQHFSNSAVTGVGRHQLARLYAGVMAQLGDSDALIALSDQLNLAGSAASLFNMTRKDQAEVNRLHRRDKKKAKRAASYVLD